MCVARVPRGALFALPRSRTSRVAGGASSAYIPYVRVAVVYTIMFHVTDEDAEASTFEFEPG